MAMVPILSRAGMKMLMSPAGARFLGKRAAQGAGLYSAAKGLYNGIRNVSRSISRGRSSKRQRTGSSAQRAPATSAPPPYSGRSTSRGTARYSDIMTSGNGYSGSFARRSGRYKGRFRRRRKRRVKKPKTLGQIKSEGCIETTEIFGEINDPDCVYIGYTAYSPIIVLNNVAKCVVKDLFGKAGIRVTNNNSPIIDMSGLSFDIVVTIYADDETSLYVNTWTTGTNTYADIEVWLSGRLRIIAEEDSSSAAVNTRNIKRIALSYVVESGVQPVHAVLYFDEMTVHCASYNELKVQNRSLSATGSSSTDTVNNNPLQGKIYDFSTQPRTAIEYMRPIMIFDASTGILLSRAAQFNDIANMKEPPSGRIFNNTKKTDKIVLQAGEIKKGNLYYKKSMPFIKFIKDLCLRQAGAEGVYGTTMTFVKCPTQIIALEDVLNVNLGNLITCAYELNRQTGITITYKKKKVQSQGYSTVSISNLGPE